MSTVSPPTTGMPTTARAVTTRVRSSRAPYVFISPFFVLYGLFMVVPIGVGAYLSLTDWAGIGSPTFVGLRNYQWLSTDSSFWTALGNTVVYVAVSMFVVLPLALLIAQGLNARGLRGRDLFRLSYFTPVVLSPIVIALVFTLFYDREFGLFNAFLRGVFGWGGIDWLGDPSWAKVSVVLLVVWKWTGYMTIFFLAGLQNIPRELYEAAELDGAGPVRSFFAVTLPVLRPVTAFVAVTTLVSSAQIFEEPYLLTQGGPGESTLSVAQFIYRAAFERQQMGYAAAAGVVMFVLVFALGRTANRVLGVGSSR